MKELEPDISSIQPGNYLKYVGPHNIHTGSIGKVLSFREMRNKDQGYLIQLLNHRHEPTVQIIASADDVREIPLREDHILKAGFIKTGNLTVYQFDSITIFNIGAIRHDEESGGQIYELGGYCATQGIIQIPRNIKEFDELKKKSVYVGEFHRFQNMMKIYYPDIEVKY